MIARRYTIRGRVQGVGFRMYVHREATNLGIRGFVRNTDDGGVEVVAVGPKHLLPVMAGLLYKGPRFAEVRGVEEQESPMQQYDSFEIR